ncbi:hypothetical protein RJZ90_002188 [Blastomyces dermatitidis]
MVPPVVRQHLSRTLGAGYHPRMRSSREVDQPNMSLKVDLIYEDYKDLLEPPMQSMRDTVQLQLRRIPDRQIFDFLMQYLSVS